MPNFKKLFTVLIVVLLLCQAVPCFAAGSGPASVAFDEITITGQGPVGVELVKTDKDTVTIEYLNVENRERYSVTQAAEDGKMLITITNSAPKEGVSVQFGPEVYQNVIRVHIPNITYKAFAVNAYEMVVQMQDFKAPVQAAGERGGISVIDENIKEGTYHIQVKSGPVSIKATSILSDLDVNVEDGPITLRFGEQPQNLSLDTTNCGPVVKRPDTWAAKYETGNGTPKITLKNTRGYTTVAVG